MRIDELIGVKRFAGMGVPQIIDFIQSNIGSNIKVLGQGAFGTALTNGTDVFKLWMQDSAYTDFVKYCLNNQSNPFLPKFKGQVKKMPAFFLRHEEAPDFIYYVKMEKLEPYKEGKMGFELKVPEDAYPDEDGDFITYVNLKKVLEFLGACDVDSPISIMNQFLAKLSSWNGCHYESSDLDDELQLFINTMTDIKSLGHSIDLHSGNMMYRGMQLVLADPIANRDDMQLARKFDAFNMKLKYGAPQSGVKSPTRRTSSDL